MWRIALAFGSRVSEKVIDSVAESCGALIGRFAGATGCVEIRSVLTSLKP